jgi:hypothetical protein
MFNGWSHYFHLHCCHLNLGASIYRNSGHWVCLQSKSRTMHPRPCMHCCAMFSEVSERIRLCQDLPGNQPSPVYLQVQFLILSTVIPAFGSCPQSRLSRPDWLRESGGPQKPNSVIQIQALLLSHLHSIHFEQPQSLSILIPSLLNPSPGTSWTYLVGV